LFRESTELPSAWEAQKQIGEILFSKTEQYESAIQHYQYLLKNNPDAPEAVEFLFRIGKSQFFLWRFNDAVETYRQLIHKFPSTPWAEKAALEIGTTYFTRGEQRPGGSGPGMESYQDAILAYQSFLKIYPKSTLADQAEFGIASCYEELDQLDAAYQLYESLLKTYPSPNVIKIKLARLQERKKQRSH
jgi:TolA-binding protein